MNHYMSTDDVFLYVKARLRAPESRNTLRPGHEHRSPATIAGQPASPPNTAGTQKKRVGQSIVEFWSGEDCPPDTLNKFILLTARMLRYEVSEEDAVGVLERYCFEHPASGFSDRLSAGKTSEVVRVIRSTVRTVYANNGGQADPQTSSRILDKAHAFFQKIGFKVSDRATWCKLGKAARQLSPTFEWSLEELAVIQQHLVPILNTDLDTAQLATKHFLRFVHAHQGQGISRDSLPMILQQYAVNIRKSKKKSAFLQKLIELGWLVISQDHKWCLRGSGIKGEARHYEVGPPLAHNFPGLDTGSSNDAGNMHGIRDGPH